MTEFGDPTIVKDKIISYLQIDENEYQEFINSLKKYKAVIAGGFVLSCFTGFTSNDIDIYITSKNMKKFACNLPTFLSPHSLDFISKYDSLGKKYVQRMLCYKYDKNDVPNYDIKVDIVIIDDNYTIEQVINNFDLSFCKIWFDGDNVYASHPKDIKRKNGSLNKIYLNNYYLAFKKKTDNIDLLHQRNKKYTRRGFIINVANDPRPGIVYIPPEKKNIPVLLSSNQTDENIAIKLILQNFTNINIVKYLIDDIQFYSNYIKKYLSDYYYTEGNNNERVYIQKITLFKFYFICLFKEFTFEEFKKNFRKLFNNVRIEYIYKSALYSLQQYLYEIYRIKPANDFSSEFKNRHGLIVFEPKAAKVISFITINMLNKYEKYRFTRLIDYNYLKGKYNFNKYVFKDRNIDIHKIDSSEFATLLKIDEEDFQITKKAHVIDLLKKSELKGFDFINQEADVNISEYLSEDKENIIIFMISRDNKTSSITCISKNNLDTMISDINDNWLYDCDAMTRTGVCRNDSPNTIKYKESKYLYKPFIKISLSTGNFYFEYNYIYSLFMSKQQVFFAYYTSQEINKTASYKNTYEGERNGLSNHVSSNWCQDGTNILLCEIKTLILDGKTSFSSSSLSLSKSSSSK
jgi:hypothetical protein